MTEDLQFILPILFGLLWRAGGRPLPLFRKNWRRIILPLLIFAVGVQFFPIWKIGLVTLTALLIFRLGYGEDTHPLLRIGVALSYGFYDALLGVTLWSFIVPLVWLGLWYMSNSKLRYQAPWAICEMLFGIVLGIKYITLM